jgi:large subunit ribosomal protein L27
MSKTKAGGTTKNNRDSAGRRHGVKVFAGETIKTGGIIVRQAGSTKISGPGTKMGRDFTIFAMKDGVVAFNKTRIRRFTGKTAPRTQVRVV